MQNSRMRVREGRIKTERVVQDNAAVHRVRVTIHGAVQGVGFRPFVYRLARELSLRGWVLNSAQGVFIEAEGDAETLRAFLVRVRAEIPPRAFIQSMESCWLQPAGYADFEIRHSDASASPTALILPDIAPCPDCLAEIFDPSDRRYLYPFTNCTNCGPRFSIIDDLPYDRANTSMRAFTMCVQCEAEYRDPADRRFHAQPNACPDCGPRLELRNAAGTSLCFGPAALLQAATLLRQGRIVAVKGAGGFHLMADARNDAAIVELRARKHREEKPLAVMFPSLEMVRQWCDVSDLEAGLLASAEAPIVLVRNNGRGGDLAEAIAPNNPYLGAMLPSSPLHAILLREVDFPLIATSGNISDEPICIHNDEACARLRGIADAFLVHDRPIRRHVDDSIAREMAGREMLLRRARGYAPLPVALPGAVEAMLAVGAHQKNTVAIAVAGNVFLSQHIGDLSTLEAREAFRRVQEDLARLYHASPTHVACDLHPDYASTVHARNSGLPCTPVQHHAAHIAACMAENQLEGQVLGVAWDGTGFGPDGTIWGGEFLLSDGREWMRFAALRNFPLPGGDGAAREPRKSALGILLEMFGDHAFEMHDLPCVQSFRPAELALFRSSRGDRSLAPRTSSAGRLFDAVASITGIRQHCGFEGQAAMELEYAADGIEGEAYPFELVENYVPMQRNDSTGNQARSELVVDWGLSIHAMLADLRHGVSLQCIAARFHATLAAMILSVAYAAAVDRVVLSGGCFQNRILTESAVKVLRAGGVQPFWHQRIPPNDGGIALGQIASCRVP